jgi:mannonate dehydratase
MNRRNLMKGVGLSIAAGTLGIISKTDKAIANEYAKATKGLPPLKITNVKAILTTPQRIRLCVVKVETSEPGLSISGRCR